MKSREERIEHIRKVFKVANEDQSLTNYYTIKQWRGKSLYRKIIQIDSEFLMFRIENSRTEIQQLTYIRKNALPINFFNDPEALLVQEAQENILIEMVRNKGKDFIDDLKLRKQEDSCIITYDGYLVNGNRRTAALKFLGERYIDCIVLPEDTTPKDIYFLEQQLQITEDFREPYHWINELKNIRKGIDDTRLGFTEEELATNLRLDLKDLRVKLRMLDLIDAFLIWKKIPGQYDYPKLDDTKEIFQQLEKAVKKYKNNTLKRKALQNKVFSLIECRPQNGRLYNQVMELFRSFELVNKKLKVEIKKSDEIKTENEEPKNDLVDDLIEDIANESDELFDNPENAQEASGKLVEAIADVQAENKEKRDTEAVYNSVSAALRELQGLIIDNETAKLDSIKTKLDQIINVSKKLLDEANTFENQE